MTKQELIELWKKIADLPNEQMQVEFDKLSKEDFNALMEVSSQETKKSLQEGRKLIDFLRENLSHAQA